MESKEVKSEWVAINEILNTLTTAEIQLREHCKNIQGFKRFFIERRIEQLRLLKNEIDEFPIEITDEDMQTDEYIAQEEMDNAGDDNRPKTRCDSESDSYYR